MLPGLSVVNSVQLTTYMVLVTLLVLIDFPGYLLNLHLTELYFKVLTLSGAMDYTSPGRYVCMFCKFGFQLLEVPLSHLPTTILIIYYN